MEDVGDDWDDWDEIVCFVVMIVTESGSLAGINH